MNFSKSKYLLFLIVIISSSFGIGGKVFAAGGICAGYDVNLVCGGESNSVTNSVCTCNEGYICVAIYPTACFCELAGVSPYESYDCGTPSASSCGDPDTLYKCGVEGGCGVTQAMCGPVSWSSLPACVPSVTNCPCLVGITCPDTYVCENGACTNPDASTTPVPIGYVDPAKPYGGPIINNLPALLSPIFKLLFYAGIFIGILGIIYSGYLLMASEGDPGRAKEGKEQFTAAILGSLFILLSVFILRAIIDSILGVNSGL